MSPQQFPPTAPREADEGFSLTGILGTLRRRWWLALILGVPASLALAAAAWFLVPAHYTAVTTLRIAAREPKLVFDTADTQIDFNTYRQTQIALVRSRLVLESAVNDPDIADLPMVRARKRPAKWLENALQIESPTSPELLQLSLDGEDADQVAAVVNGVAKAYMNEVVNAERRRRLERLDDLERIFAETEEKARVREERLGELTKKLGTGDARALTVRQQMALEYFGRLQREHADVRFELMRERVRDQSNGEVAAELPTAGNSTTTGPRSDIPETVGQRVAELRRIIERFQRQVRDPDHPSLVEYRRELASLERLRHRLDQPVDAAGRPIAEDRLTVLERQEEVLRSELNEYAALVDAIGTGSFEIESMKGELDQVTRVADRIGSEMEALRVELQSPPRVTLLETAEPPTTLDDSRRLKFTLMGGLAGFGLVAGLLVLLDIGADRVSNAEQIGQRIGMDVLGSLPDLDADAHGVVSPNWTDAVDSTRNLLLHRVESAGQRILFVTTAAADEGGIETACELGKSLARSGRNTIVVECDVRTRGLAGQLGLGSRDGLAEVLDGRESLEVAVQSTTTPNLWGLTAGLSGMELSRDRVRPLFERLLEMFEYVVVVGGPILTDANATSVATASDVGLLVVRRDVSQFPRVQEARRRLAVLEVPFAGALLVGNLGRRAAPIGFDLGRPSPVTT